MASEHQATDWYVRRMPSPPRISVPPPAMTASRGVPKPPETWQQVLEGVDLDQIFKIDDPLEWTYPSRRQAQIILPFLYLGPMTAAKDRTFLEKQGVTMMLAVRHLQTIEAKMMQGGLRLAEEMGIEMVTIDVSSSQELITAFPRATEIINNHILRRRAQNLHGAESPTPGKVLVYCESGNERSAAVVIAYILEVFNAELVQAIQVVQARRFCINVDDPMRHLLRTYEDLIRARAEVSCANKNLQIPSNSGIPASEGRSPTKRGLDSDIDSDTEMEDMDIERFKDRAFVPFRDKD